MDVPSPREWGDWVSASRTRNWCIRNPLQDWLELYGETAGFVKDPIPDPRTDFRDFVFEKGREFETKVVELLRRRIDVVSIEGFEKPTTDFDACAATFEAIRSGAPCIAQGVLWNPENRTYGAADLLVRSDVLAELFPQSIAPDEVRLGAPGIGLRDCHYRVVDIKYTTLKLDRHWNASREHLPYLAQVFVYNEALGRIQGFLPPASYLLGRSWTGPAGAEGRSCMDRLAPVPNDLAWKHGSLRDSTAAAIEWVRRLRRDGGGWHPVDGPSSPELRPNPGAADYPWQRATRVIAEATADPILAWQVGCDGRDAALTAGVKSWTDPRFSAVTAGVAGSRARRLDVILDQNRDAEAPCVVPDRISAEREVWGEPEALEFYVDFETVSDVADDFAKLPERGGQPMIFMIGCGHIEGEQWRFECFVADALDPASEATIIERWLQHMERVRLRLTPELAQPLVFHWSPAESSGLTTGLKSARARHPDRSASWKEPRWFDFLGRVMREEPVVVKGPMGFGLKTVAGSLQRHGLIQTSWHDNVTDGLGAMVGAWRAYVESGELGIGVTEHELMRATRTYNQVDCKVMLEAVQYLRDHH
jgi:hypothetical protein